MAVFSAVKNKKNRKLREGIEELANKCGNSGEEDAVVQLIDVSQTLEFKLDFKNSKSYSYGCIFAVPQIIKLAQFI